MLQTTFSNRFGVHTPRSNKFILLIVCGLSAYFLSSILVFFFISHNKNFWNSSCDIFVIDNFNFNMFTTLLVIISICTSVSIYMLLIRCYVCSLHLSIIGIHSSDFCSINCLCIVVYDGESNKQIRNIFFVRPKMDLNLIMVLRVFNVVTNCLVTTLWIDIIM